MGYGTNGVGTIDGTQPSKLQNGGWAGAGIFLFQEEFDLALATVDKVAGTNNVVCDLPPGFEPVRTDVVSSVSLTTSQLAFGITGTTNKYGVAKAYGTTAEALVSWVKATALALFSPRNTRERLIMTNSGADLPASGKIYVLVWCRKIG